MNDIMSAAPGSVDDKMVLAAIREIRRRCKSDGERLAKFRQLKAVTEAKHKDGQSADVLADVRLCIDEIEHGG